MRQRQLILSISLNLQQISLSGIAESAMPLFYVCQFYHSLSINYHPKPFIQDKLYIAIYFVNRFI
jgi:hypothetical protein